MKKIDGALTKWRVGFCGQTTPYSLRTCFFLGGGNINPLRDKIGAEQSVFDARSLKQLPTNKCGFEEKERAFLKDSITAPRTSAQVKKKKNAKEQLHIEVIEILSWMTTTSPNPTPRGGEYALGRTYVSSVR